MIYTILLLITKLPNYHHEPGESDIAEKGIRHEIRTCNPNLGSVIHYLISIKMTYFPTTCVHLDNIKGVIED